MRASGREFVASQVSVPHVPAGGVTASAQPVYSSSAIMLVGLGCSTVLGLDYGALLRVLGSVASGSQAGRAAVVDFERGGVPPGYVLSGDDGDVLAGGLHLDDDVTVNGHCFVPSKVNQFFVLSQRLSAVHARNTNTATGCGRPLVSERIVGGTDSQVGEWPWKVSLQRDGFALCGGSLISDSWVLTSAHCFETPVNISAYATYLGVSKLSDLQNPSTVVRRLKQVIIHPTFSGEGSSGDIALVQLEEPVNFSPHVLPVCLPPKTLKLAEGTLCWATGWGDIKDGVPLPSPGTLQKVQLALIDNKNCESMYQTSLGYNPKIKLIQKDMLCAGYKEGKKDSCQGDSGGPLVYNMDGVWVQIGIVSWGFGCAEPKHPGVYTSVQYYLSWIEDSITERKMEKFNSLYLTNNINITKQNLTFQPNKSSLSYMAYDKNVTESGNLTDNNTDPNMGNAQPSSGAHSNLWSMANVLLILLGLVLLL
ncbi:serine protease 27-like [Bufo gargarizans]|uniref:serine protease 27-like n=1 Tax=Bufo gargarizans TaxID=30331 RepID=UPI001CF24454|nr:serine protease 27-like [Bufo gargarizans]